jgi:hypothetical protein
MIARMVLMACCAPFVFAGCARSGIFRGHYTHHLEVSRFEPCASRESWWVIGEVRPLVHASAGQRVYAELRGDVSGIGSYGHLGAYRRELVVSEVIVIRPAADSDCRGFYDEPINSVQPTASRVSGQRWLSFIVGRTQMRRFYWLAVVVMGCSWGCGAPKYVEDLKTPALVWTQARGGLCSKIVAVDGEGVVWMNQGCEDGRPELNKIRTATQTQVDDLWAKFDALPLDHGVTLECSWRLRHSFARWDAQSRRGTSACGGTQYDDISSLPDRYKPLAEAVKGLE